MLSVYTGRYFGLTYIRRSDVPVFVGSGRYRFTYPWDRGVTGWYQSQVEYECQVQKTGRLEHKGNIYERVEHKHHKTGNPESS